jgi:lysophospholipase-2
MQRSFTAAAMSTTNNSNKKGALIFLHGLGDSPAGWSDLKRMLPSLQPRLSQLEFIFPAAPTIPITINGGATMPGWFDLYDWPIEVGSKDDPEGLQAGVASIEEQVKQLNAKGIPSDKIVLGGFSQGGAVAVLAAYQAKTTTTYAGCVGLSAWLTLPEQLKVSEAAKKTPMYWGHGTFDDKVVFPQQSFGVGKLREQGVNVKDESFSMGHSSDPDEMQSFADFVDQRIFAGESSGTGSSEL